MKKYKKFWAVLLTLAMVLGMSMTTMAAGNVPNEDDKADIVVENVEKSATVAAYKIIGADYDNGLVGYKWLVGDNVNQKVTFDNEGNVNGLTTDFITNYAKTVNVDPNTTATAGTDNTATLGGLTVGTYMILVTPTTTGVTYNPMIASVNYSTTGSGSDNTAGDGSVNANTKWKVKGTVVYAKSSALALTKELDDDTKEVVANGEKDAEKINFTVTTTIPSYSKAYTTDEFKFEIKDDLNNGLRYANTEPVVKVGTGTLTKGTEYTSTFDATQKSFTITFEQEYLRSLAGKTDEQRSVEITYGAYATEAATVATPGENTVTLYYSDTPGTTQHLTDTEKVYTFDITGAVKKVKEDGQNALPGATFTLYRGYDATTKTLSDEVKNYTTVADGAIVFSGLGAVETVNDVAQAGTGTYYLKETAAPATYTINDTVYKVEIKNIIRNSATDDTIKSYDVVVTNLTDNTVTTTTITVGNVTPTGTTTNIVNTKLTALPSTGGIGTTIFTIGGCAIMIAAAFLFFASRKKNDNK